MMQCDLLNPVCILKDIYFGHDIYLKLPYYNIQMKINTHDVEEMQAVHFWSWY